ncbi:MAG: class I SAM-dependent methyltransferase, partial [Promethearchaeota archaeon]
MNLYKTLIKIEKKINKIFINTEEKNYWNLSWRRFNYVLNNFIPLSNKNITILDVGAAPHHFSIILKELGYNVSTIDSKEDKWTRRAMDLGIDINIFDIESDDFLDIERKFDIILFLEIFEHLNYYKLPKIMFNLRKLMHGDSILILTTPNLASIENRLLLLLGKPIINWTHQREYSYQQVEDIMRKSGYILIKRDFIMVRDLISRDKDNKILRHHILTGVLKNP